MLIGKGCNLRKVRHAEHLIPFRERLQLSANRLRRAPADAGIDFVEDKCALLRGILLRDRILVADRAAIHCDRLSRLARDPRLDARAAGSGRYRANETALGLVLRPMAIPAASAPVSSATTVAQAPNAQKPQIKFAKPIACQSGGPGAGSATLADLNGDGRLDVIVTTYSQSTNLGEVAVLIGNGDGTFQSAVIYGTGAYGPTSVAVGDVNGDGIPDLVVGNECMNLNPNGLCAGSVGALSVLLGNGDGTFQPAVTYAIDYGAADSVALADLRHTGILDAVVTDLIQDGQNYESAVGVLLGNGDGTFQPVVNYYSGGLGCQSTAVADVNGDGVPDIVTANPCQSESCQSDGTAGVLLGNGDGTFQPAVTYDSGALRPDWVSVGDLRGIGIIDLVMNGGTGHNIVASVLLGNGDGTFQTPVTYAVDGTAGGGMTAIGDLNGDGIPDLVVTASCPKFSKQGVCVGDSKLSILLGNGDGTFQPQIVYSSGGFPTYSAAIGDVNGDGRKDLVATNGCGSGSCYNPEGSIAVLLNQTSYATKTALTASPNPAQINQSVTFTATITPNPPNGELVTFSNGKTTLGTGTTASGTATLTTTFPAAKTYTIKASYPGDPFRRKSSGTMKLVVNP